MNTPKILTCEAHGSKLILELPRDADWDDMINAFNTILLFQTFQSTVQEMVEDEVIYNYEEKNREVLLSNVINNDSWQII